MGGMGDWKAHSDSPCAFYDEVLKLVFRQRFDAFGASLMSAAGWEQQDTSRRPHRDKSAGPEMLRFLAEACGWSAPPVGGANRSSDPGGKIHRSWCCFQKLPENRLY